MIDNSIGWAKTKNPDILYNSLAVDSGLFIYHPDSKSTVRCLDDMRQLEKFWMNPEFQATRYDIRDLRISFSPSCDAAWFSAVLDDSATFKGRPIGWKDARWTGVLEKIDDQWKIAQMHFSFASD